MVARQSKPVVASFADVAASGGYYVAAGADTIFTNPATITGSIGVIAGWPVIQRLLDMVDVTSDSIQSTPNAAWRHMELGLPESEMKKLSAHIDETYETFKMVVSSGRTIPMEMVEDLARGQVYTGAQALGLGLVDKIGGLNEALDWAGLLSLEKENLQDHAGLREKMNPEMLTLFDDSMVGGEKTQELVRDTLKSSTMYGGEEPDPDKVRALVKRVTVSVRPQVSTVIIPHINLANEAFGVALASAFQTDDERSPIPVDQPTEMGDINARGNLVVGALLGIAQSNNIPWWQLPAFCYWYASQATGKAGTGSFTGGFLHNWFSRIMTDGVYKDTGRKTRLFTGGKTAWDIRMELPPLEILS